MLGMKTRKMMTCDKGTLHRRSVAWMRRAASALAACLAFTTGAFAQDDDGEDALDEIVVTATR
ncbi:MAG: hypothetical protein ACYS9X_27305, partial [Planctomycetota bacterium]